MGFRDRRPPFPGDIMYTEGAGVSLRTVPARGIYHPVELKSMCTGTVAHPSPTIFSATLVYCFAERPQSEVRPFHFLPPYIVNRTFTRAHLIFPCHRTVNMDEETSFIVNAEVQIIQNMMTSRYFAAAALVLLLYDTIITMDDEVSGFLPQPHYAHSL